MKVDKPLKRTKKMKEESIRKRVCLSFRLFNLVYHRYTNANIGPWSERTLPLSNPKEQSDIFKINSIFSLGVLPKFKIYPKIL